MDPVMTVAAMAAGRRGATRCGLRVDDIVVLHNSNRLTVRLRPCDVIARIAPASRRASAEFEVVVATRLSETGAPVAPLEPRLDPCVFDEAGFAVTLWAYYEPVPPVDVEAKEYAGALARLHEGMRQADLSGGWLGHFMDRVTEARSLVDDPANDREIAGADRELVSATLRDASGAVVVHGAPEQLLQGEPHPGNVVRTESGLMFLDLETCCQGPVEFDIAHATIVQNGPPIGIADHYPGADSALVRQCWRLVLALAIAWRFEPGDDLPDGIARARDWIGQLRADPQ